jgi:hypothetical protein
MGPRNAYKYMLDNVVSPITCVSMNHQNQLEQMANGAMFATISPFLVIYDNTSKASINLQKLTKLESLTLAWMLTIIQTPPRSNFPLFYLLFLCSLIACLFLLWNYLACFGHILPLCNKISKSPKQKRSKDTSKT